MTKQIKRTLSLVLAMIMIVGTFAVFPLTSSATQDKAFFHSLTPH